MYTIGVLLLFYSDGRCVKDVNIYHIIFLCVSKVSPVYIFQCFETKDKKGEIIHNRRTNTSTSKPIFFQFIIITAAGGGMRTKRAEGRVGSGIRIHNYYIYYYF